MPADDHLSKSLFSGLAQSAKDMDPENRSFVEGALRNAGKGYSGPIDAFDADQIERSKTMISALRSSGVGTDFGNSEYPRGAGFFLPSGHQVTLTPDRRGVHVRVDSPDYEKSHATVLPVESMHDVPRALMDHLATPEVRHRAGL